jgi:hypothetical protein
MTVTDITDLTGRSSRSRSRSLGPARSGRLPLAFNRCSRVVAVTAQLPEFLLAAAGSVQRLDASGVRIDLLELSWQDASAERAAVRSLERLELRMLTRHRLAIPAPFGVERTDDVVAAMSELIGFDPEPGVVCLVPGCADTNSGDTDRADANRGDPNRSAYQAVDAATALIADAYRLRTVRYSPAAEARTAEVDLDDDEWRRKCDGLKVCAPDVAVLSGRREYLAG